MKMRCAVYFAFLFLAACSSGSSITEETLVFAYGPRQCESGISLESSAQILIDAGIDVLKSSCGAQTGYFYPAVAMCGMPSGLIWVHEIRTVNLSDAEQLGFHEISILVDASAGAGYQLIDCAIIGL